MKFSFDRPTSEKYRKSEAFNEINKELANLDVAAPFNTFYEELSTQDTLIGLSDAYMKHFKHPQQRAEDFLASILVNNELFEHFAKLQQGIDALEDVNERNVLSGSYDAKLIDFVSRVSDLFASYGNLKDNQDSMARFSSNLSQLHCFDTENEVEMKSLISS